MPSALDSRGQTTLMKGAVAGDTASHNFPAFVDKSSEHAVIIETDNPDLVLTKPADFPSSRFESTFKFTWFFKLFFEHILVPLDHIC